MSGELEAALAAIDAANGQDPGTIDSDGRAEPRELVYGRRMSAWLERLAPDAGEPLRIAVRAQHIQRWKIPRGDYPQGRAGYKRWRADLARMHAELAAGIAAAAGYDPAACSRVRDLVQKRRLRTDPDAAVLEDCACLVFLEHYFADFSPRHDRAKVIDILRKTWAKMSPRGQAAALGLPLGPAERALVEEALAPPAPPAADD